MHRLQDPVSVLGMEEGEGNTEEDRECRSAYDQLKGHIMGLAVETYSKALLMRDLDLLYEKILSSQESARNAGERSSTTAGSAGAA